MLKKIINESALIMGANVISRGLGMALMPLITPLLGARSYGEAALFSTAVSLLSVLALSGMDMSYTRAYHDRKYKKKEVEIYSWNYVYISYFIVSVCAFLGWYIYKRDLNSAILIAAGVASSGVMAMSQTKARLNSEIIRLAIGIIFGGVFSSVVTYYSAKNSWFKGENCIIIGYLVGYIIPILFTGVIFPIKNKFKTSLSLGEKYEIWKIGVAGIVTAPMFWLISSVDRWFLNYHVDSKVIGIYSVGVTIATIGMFLNSAFISVWMKEIVGYYEKENFDKIYITKVAVNIIYGLSAVWLFLAVFGGYLLKVLTTSEFHGAVVYIPWISGGVLFYGFYHIIGTGLFLSKNLKYSAKAMIIAGVFVVTCNFIFVNKYGAIACSIIQMVGFFLAALIVYLESKKLNLNIVPAGAVLKIVVGILFIYGISKYITSNIIVIEILSKMIFVVCALFALRIAMRLYKK